MDFYSLGNVMIVTSEAHTWEKEPSRIGRLEQTRMGKEMDIS